METEAAGLDVVEAAALELFRIDGRAVVAQQNFEPFARTRRAGTRDAAEDDFNGLVQLAEIGMPHDVSQSFVDRAGDGASVLSGTMEKFGETLESASDGAEQPGVAAQFEFEEETVRAAGACVDLSLCIIRAS